LANYPDVGAIQQRYSEFALGHGYRKSPFWQAILKLQAALDPAVPRFGFVWTNLFPCDQRKTLPLIEWHDALRAHAPFRAELEILRPELIVCFTGPYYDYTLRHYLPEAAWSNVASESGLLLHRLTVPTGPRLVLRTYHPNYLVQRKILEQTVTEIVHLARALFTGTAAVPASVAA
jgi:hypothetical protein